MDSNDKTMGNKGDEVMKAVGELKSRTRQLNEIVEDEGTDADEVGNWITIIGKAILAIFK